MASYHCSVKVGAKGKAGPHASYISREGKYEKTRSNEKLEHVESGNMPKWAEKDPAQFWQSADQHERANGATYREIEVALPREMTPEQRVELVRDMVGQELGDKHAYTWAIHNPPASLEGGEQPHAHIMYSERTIDGIDRDPEQYFKRYNAKNTEKGGCRKDSAGTEERLLATRERWADVQNLHLERHGLNARVDHRSLKDQGTDRTPEPHFGPGRIQRMTATQDAELAAVLERRAAEGAKDRADAELGRSIIDLSGDLSAAKADRTRQQEATASLIEAKLARYESGVDAKLAAFEAKAAALQAERDRAAAIERQRIEQLRKAEQATALEKLLQERRIQQERTPQRAARPKSPVKDNGPELDM
ncbi:MobA/MobL family protein [Massilia sp. P8910]|uniref:MobA/MobL family protein n=1 Tax=Massilia antarctica TaxID=2765360 RepID=UPI001E547376|nr:MobA/MobL family protein [Massilia antarctica]MCE3601999.1 MobA/MobL family protein [Massilia antarctica]